MKLLRGFARLRPRTRKAAEGGRPVSYSLTDQGTHRWAIGGLPDVSSPWHCHPDSKGGDHVSYGRSSSPAWALGWLVTSYVITANVEEQFAVFGGSGALVFGLLTWLLLAVLFRGTVAKVEEAGRTRSVTKGAGRSSVATQPDAERQGGPLAALSRGCAAPGSLWKGDGLIAGTDGALAGGCYP